MRIGPRFCAEFGRELQRQSYVVHQLLSGNDAAAGLDHGLHEYVGKGYERR